MDKYIGFDVADKKTIAWVIEKGCPDSYQPWPGKQRTTVREVITVTEGAGEEPFLASLPQRYVLIELSLQMGSF